ncbi:MAG: argininosuccinate synthase [bacterium]|nr:argininosuccinate synthase [bacterium]
MNKVLLAFSGGLDTSYCARYLAVDLGMDVHSVIVDTGGFSSDDLARIEARAHACKVSSHTALDRTQELYDKVLRHCIAGNILKNATYPLSVSAERCIQAIAIAEHALAIGATHLAHGSTGAGNDQIRFDVIFRILCPDITVLTPIRDQRLSREDEIAYLTSHGVQGDWTKSNYSINQGIWGTTIGGKETLISNLPLPDDVWPSNAMIELRANNANNANNADNANNANNADNANETTGRNTRLQQKHTGSQTLRIGFENGQPCSLDDVRMDAVACIRALNDIGASYGIGRDMHVGDTIIGIKGRVAFEAPAALMMIKAHHALEKHVLTKWQLNLKDQLSMWYGQLLHEGQFLEPAMRSIEAFFNETQRNVTGTVDLALSPLTFSVLGLSSLHDMMRSTFATYGEMNRAFTGDDAKGFASIAAVSTMINRSVSMIDRSVSSTPEVLSENSNSSVDK